MPRIGITEEPIDIAAMIHKARRAEAGALSIFVGTVRNHAQGREVHAIDYSAYAPMAERIMAQIDEECRTQWPDAQVSIAHRVGHLTVGDDAVVIVVSAPHRDEAFQACRHTIERLKEDCPIWKKEWDADGASWVSPRP